MKLFTEFRLRDIELKNRIAVSSMCEYSAEEGHPVTWHLVHLGSRAVGPTTRGFPRDILATGSRFGFRL